MKNLIFRASFLLLPLLVVAMFIETGVTSNSDSMNKATCPITITFCIEGAGSGRAISIFANGNCTSTAITTIYTGSDGCAQYTFTNCNATYSVQETCVGLGTCQYFNPINVPGSKIDVIPCK